MDGVSDEPPVLCEVWAHEGSSKVAQSHKVLHDAVKLFLAAEVRSPQPRLVLALRDAAAAPRFRGRSWYAVALRRLGVELLVVTVLQDVRDTIGAAQTRQFRQPTPASVSDPRHSRITEEYPVSPRSTPTRKRGTGGRPSIRYDRIR